MTKFSKDYNWSFYLYTSYFIINSFLIGDGSKIFSKEGFSFFTGTDWNAVVGRESFGALSYIIGQSSIIVSRKNISIKKLLGLVYVYIVLYE
ncbi:MAG: hypothetical protein ACM3XP_03665 [Nitrososphaerales archaeon]